MNKIVLSVETTCDISKEELEKMGVRHISLTYRSETTGEENLDLSIVDFYDRIRQGETFKTSLINEYEFEEYFKELVKEGDVLHIGFDGTISGTNKCAVDAAEKVNKLSKNKVYVIDTLTGSGGQAIILREALKQVNKGKSIEEIVDYINDFKMRVTLYFSPEDMKTLAKSGRLNKIVALIGGILNIKPIIHVNNNGEFVSKQKVISRKRALQRMVEIFKEKYNFESEYVYILHGDKYADADYIKREIMKDDKYSDVKFIVDYLGVIVGAHGGPGNMCICFTSSER